MIKLEFKNAKVTDHGYGAEVNDKSLENIISTALGTRVGGNYGGNSDLPNFYSNCCNVTIIIDPQPVTTHIEDSNNNVFTSIADLEEGAYERYKAKDAEASPEE
jgi:hypothetical protein